MFPIHSASGQSAPESGADQDYGAALVLDRAND
jgi:hypothetical protein